MVKKSKMISDKKKTAFRILQHDSVFWLRPKDAPDTPFVSGFKLEIEAETTRTVSFYIHAEERYELFLNGSRVGRGSERGDHEHAFCEEYTITLVPGKNLLVARVWRLGNISPFAQMNAGNGLVVFADDPETNKLLGSGIAPWLAKLLGGYDFIYPHPTCTTGANFIVDGTLFDWDFELGAGDDWEVPVAVPEHNSNRFIKASLPQMLDRKINSGTIRHIDSHCGEPVLPQNHLADEVADWTPLLQKRCPLKIAPNSTRRVIIDLEEYYCSYTALSTSGGNGCTITISWAEALYANNQDDDRNSIKGNRDDIDCKYFCGVGDIFKLDGGKRRRYENLWWQAGRYVEIKIVNGAEELTVNEIIFNETRYPFEPDSSIRTSENKLNQALPMMIRTLQMCIHETYMDCPYYEQLMYIGDARLQILTTYVLTSDRRAPEKAIKLLGASILDNNLTQSRYPSREQQIIPPFSLWWIAMVHDYAMWNDNIELVAVLQTGVRNILKAFADFKNASGLIESPDGWNFCDWAQYWTRGVPPGGEHGVCTLINWQYVMALKMASELETYLGNPQAAGNYLVEACKTAGEIDKVFWNDELGLYSDDLSGEHFSEHTQSLALLSGLVPKAKIDTLVDSLCTNPRLTKATIYFSYYLFEVFYRFNRIDKLLDSIEYWDWCRRQGFKTTPERPEPSRSDCHGWGAHPIYHFYSSLAGIRPGKFGGRTFYIRPQFGSISEIEGTMECLDGKIDFCFRKDAGTVRAAIAVPAGVEAVFEYAGDTYSLNSGENKFLLVENSLDNMDKLKQTLTGGKIQKETMECV